MRLGANCIQLMKQNESSDLARSTTAHSLTSRESDSVSDRPGIEFEPDLPPPRRIKSYANGGDSQLGEILALHEEIVRAARTSLNQAIRIGELLTAKKAALAHGKWLPWLAANVPFNERTARNYVRVFQNREQLRSESISDLVDAYRLLTEGQKDEQTNESSEEQRGESGGQLLQMSKAEEEPEQETINPKLDALDMGTDVKTARSNLECNKLNSQSAPAQVDDLTYDQFTQRMVENSPPAARKWLDAHLPMIASTMVADIFKQPQFRKTRAGSALKRHALYDVFVLVRIRPANESGFVPGQASSISPRMQKLLLDEIDAHVQDATNR